MAYQDPDDRLEGHYALLGTRTPRCCVPGCAETDPRALVGVNPNIVCYEHQHDAQSRAWLEEHHVAGRRNDPATVQIPGNDHRILSDLQQAWPRDTLRNPNTSPLLRAAAALRGFLDVLRLVIERTVGWIPALLEALDGWLRETVGESWWKDFPTAGSDVA
jgi:hypothetical protein